MIEIYKNKAKSVLCFADSMLLKCVTLQENNCLAISEKSIQLNNTGVLGNDSDVTL